MKILALSIILAAGCAYQSVQPGHLGLRYKAHGGLQRDSLPEGRYNLGWCLFRDCGRIFDFDVTFSTSHQELKTTSQEGLALDLMLSLSYKPITSELYELETEIGANYYDEVVAPEFRSAASGVFARHSYQELAANKEKVEDEIEQDVQRRIKGKHVMISSVVIESIGYAAEIQSATRDRIVGEQEALRQKAAMENETQRIQQKIQNETAEQELKLRMDLAAKKNEREIAEQDALLEKARAEGTIAKAKADAEAMTILARAHADENRAQTQAISPLTVQLKAYEALGKLGGTGTTIMLGDFSHIPQFLFPPGYGNGALTPFLNAVPRNQSH